MFKVSFLSAQLKLRGCSSASVGAHLSQLVSKETLFVHLHLFFTPLLHLDVFLGLRNLRLLSSAD